VVTSTRPEDGPIVDLCQRLGIGFFRGDLENVLDRFYQAACTFKPDHIVRLTADCPLIDPEVVDRTVELYQEQRCDYATNCMPPTFPKGLDAEIFSYDALARARKEALLPFHKEHVTPYFYEQPGRFKTTNLAYKGDLSDLRWTVDEAQDYELVKMIFETLYPAHPLFGMEDILGLFQKKEF
jgi:spore coat polysaccharide biosynthesis protein SpsF